MRDVAEPPHRKLRCRLLGHRWGAATKRARKLMFDAPPPMYDTCIRCGARKVEW